MLEFKLVLMLEFKLAGTSGQYRSIDEAIRTTQIIRNKCVRYWQDTRGTTPSDLNKYCAILALTVLTPPTAGHAESHAWGEKTRYAARTTVLRTAREEPERANCLAYYEVLITLRCLADPHELASIVGPGLVMVDFYT